MNHLLEYPLEDTFVPLSKNIDPSDGNCFSVLIGKNGVGKSRLLADIAQNYNKKLSPRNSVYFDGGYMPSKVIAVSTSPFDKFPPIRNRGQESPGYSYVGMRGSGIYATNAMALIASAAKGLLSKYEESYRHNNFVEVFKLLNLENNLSFVFKLSIRRFLEVKDPESGQGYRVDYLLTGIDLFDLFGDADDNAFKEILEDRAFESYMNSSDSSKREVAHALTYLWDHLETKKDALFKLDFDYRNPYEIGFSDYKKVKSILVLLDLGIVRLVDLKLKKSNGKDGRFQELSLRRASSGEQCMLVIMLGIAGFIEDGALILIDEPEISLHPSWQERFMDLLMSVFSEYSGCHFIIATHSPQVVARLAANNCFITVMGENKMYSAVEYMRRSSDYQLTELFDAPGMMNEYITRIAFSLLVKVKHQQYLEVEDFAQLNKLARLHLKLSGDDPNKELIDSVMQICEHYRKNAE